VRRHELLGVVDNVNIRNDQLTLSVKTLLEVRWFRPAVAVCVVAAEARYVSSPLPTLRQGTRATA
jgi:hypothetical protein